MATVNDTDQFENKIEDEQNELQEMEIEEYTKNLNRIQSRKTRGYNPQALQMLDENQEEEEEEEEYDIDNVNEYDNEYDNDNQALPPPVPPRTDLEFDNDANDEYQQNEERTINSSSNPIQPPSEYKPDYHTPSYDTSNQSFDNKQQQFQQFQQQQQQQKSSVSLFDKSKTNLSLTSTSLTPHALTPPPPPPQKKSRSREKSKSSDSHLSYQLRMEVLIGKEEEWCSNNEEVKHFKKHMKELKARKRQASKSRINRLDEELEIPKFTVDSNFSGETSSLLIKVIYGDFNKGLMTNGEERADDLIVKAATKMFQSSAGVYANDWVFKATGVAEYIYGEESIISFDYVRRVVKKGTPIQLTLLPRRQVLEEIREREELQHEITYTEHKNHLVYAHDEVAIHENRWEYLDYISLWDLKDHPFRIHVVGVDDIPMTEKLVASLNPSLLPPASNNDGSKSEPSSSKTLNRSVVNTLASSWVMFAVAQIFHGSEPLVPAIATGSVRFNEYPRWNEWLIWDDFEMWKLPRAAKLCITIYARPIRTAEDYNTASRSSSRNLFTRSLRLGRIHSATANGGQSRRSHSKANLSAVFGSTSILSERDVPLTWTSIQLIDFRGLVASGKMRRRGWLYESANPIAYAVENIEDPFAPDIAVDLETFNLAVVMPSGEPPLTKGEQEFFQKKEAADRQLMEAQVSREERESLITAAIQGDPLYFCEEGQTRNTQRKLLRLYRDDLRSEPQALPKVLQSIDWGDPIAVYQIHKALDEWAPMEGIDALELLGSGFADSEVREYAVLRLNDMPDAELNDLMLQLTQSLKYEPYHDSVLARFLLRRAAISPHIIGHAFYWYLKAEMDFPQIRERYGLLLQEYLSTVGKHQRQLFHEAMVVNQFLDIALQMKSVKKSESKSVLQQHLQELTLPKVFKLPLAHRLEAAGINVSGCKVMSSKKKPLWLSLKNADENADTIEILFKAGDDLRQDILTLQILNVMDRIWKQNDLDLHINAYGCVATGDSIGMLEIVTESNTVANITNEAGGAAAALWEKPLKEWLERWNTGPNMENAVENFVHSCAGYCVATFVLGIGDRHNDNIMLTKTGNLFHIDFGHFLGHFKKKYGYKRETAPFVFTPMYAYVMGGTDSENYHRFEQLCCRAYNVLRKNASIFINLFQLMLSTGIPELETVKDILWIKERLRLDLDDNEAATHMREMIKSSLKNWRTKLNDTLHIWLHN